MCKRLAWLGHANPVFRQDYLSKVYISHRRELIHHVEKQGTLLQVPFIELDFVLPVLFKAFVVFFFNWEVLVDLLGSVRFGFVQGLSVDDFVLYQMLGEGHQACHSLISQS